MSVVSLLSGRGHDLGTILSERRRLSNRGDDVNSKIKPLPENRRETGGEGVPGGEATRWKAEQSANPGGRPKTAALSHAYREKLASLIPDDPQQR